MKLKFVPRLDPEFMPMAVALREYEAEAAASNNTELLVVNVERNDGCCDYISMALLPEGNQDPRTIHLTDRLVKTLLWCRGGWKITVAGSPRVYAHLKEAYQPDGSRAFDADFMTAVYERPFEVCWCGEAERIAVRRNAASSVGRHLEGCRIGFDAGGSDRKVSAVIDGETVYSEEVVWFPKLQSDPQYHYDGILAAMKEAAAHMPRVDAIGISSAGVYVANRIMVASLFLKVGKEDFDRRVKSMYLDVAREIGADIPVEVANDGDVTALAGAMDLGCGNVLGIAMGTSEAAGFVDGEMNITGWLNELAFAPVDVNRSAMVDEWSGDYGCGVKYFSQDAVIKLAPAAGILLEDGLSPAEKLKVVQGLMQADDSRAAAIYESLGVYFGYTIAYYARFYDVEHVLIMGRVTSGEGGALLLKTAQQVLEGEFPALAEKIRLHIPDEKSRRVGQSVAAASLPQIR